MQIWFRDGLKHGDGDLPAVRRFYEQPGDLMNEAWYQAGEVWREDGEPTMVNRGGGPPFGRERSWRKAPKVLRVRLRHQLQ